MVDFRQFIIALQRCCAALRVVLLPSTVWITSGTTFQKPAGRHKFLYDRNIRRFRSHCSCVAALAADVNHCHPLPPAVCTFALSAPHLAIPWFLTLGVVKSSKILTYGKLELQMGVLTREMAVRPWPTSGNATILRLQKSFRERMN